MVENHNQDVNWHDPLVLCRFAPFFSLLFVCIYVCIYHVPYDFITCAGSHINHYSQDTEQFHPDQDPSLPFTPPPALFPDTPTFSNPLCVWVQSLGCIQCFITPWVVARQSSPFMRFSSKDTGVGWHFPTPGDHH